MQIKFVGKFKKKKRKKKNIYYNKKLQIFKICYINNSILNSLLYA